MRARCAIVERDDKNNIVFLEDLSTTTGSVSITNDAEAVVDYYRVIYGNRVRIVYKDTDGEWWEIVPDQKTWMGTGIGFKPWHGLAWDLLSRTEA